MSNQCYCGSDEPIFCNECRTHLEREAAEEERARWVQILEHGCGDNSCAFHRPVVGTTGSCQCLKRLSMEQRRAVQRGLRAIKTESVSQCEQLQDALRRVLPMAEAWFRREFDFLCDHEPGECTCDQEAHARTDINIALAALGKKLP